MAIKEVTSNVALIVSVAVLFGFVYYYGLAIYRAWKEPTIEYQPGGNQILLATTLAGIVGTFVATMLPLVNGT